MNVSPEAKKIVRQHYDPADVRTWPYFPIVMPLKSGLGPASDEECDEITWEVWDRICDKHGSFGCLPDAINEAIRLNAEYLSEKDGGE